VNQRRPVPENVLSRALRALGRIERTLFTLQWLSDPALHL
jgi:TnpA family transposase